MSEEIKLIPLDIIESNPGNRRVGGFDQVKLEQLAESIKAVGVQQPAVIRPVTRIGSSVQYQLVAGERRWRASRIAGLEALPCVVREIDDVTAMKIQYIENLQRDDIHPLDESNGYEQLIAHAGYTIEVLASEVGKSISYIYQRMKLAALIPEVRKMFAANKITAGHAILIARLGPEQQKEIIEECFCRYNADIPSVRDLDEYIHRHIMLDLSKITWKLDDSELIPGVSSCRECARRTKYQPELFADVCKEGKKDYCTNRACFEAHQAAVVARKKQELDGQDIIEVVDGYGEKTPKGAVERWEWEECKKSDPGAKKALVVAGDQPGRTTWGRLRKQSQHGMDPKEKERIRKAKEAARKAEELRVAKLDAVLQAADGKALPIEALRIIVGVIWDQWCHDHVVIVAKHEGWKSSFGNDEGAKKIKTMDQAQLTRLLLLIGMSGEIKCNTYCKPSTKTIDALMKIFGAKMPDAKKKVK